MSKRREAPPKAKPKKAAPAAAAPPPADAAPIDGGAVDRAEDFERAIREAGQSKEHYVLRLYVTGSTLRSTKAIQNIRALCEEHLSGRYDLEVIDIYQQPVLARGEQIIAAPTLIKRLPEPLRKVVGDLSNTDRVLMGLDLRPAGDGNTAAAPPGGTAPEAQG